MQQNLKNIMWGLLAAGLLGLPIGCSIENVDPEDIPAPAPGPSPTPETPAPPSGELPQNPSVPPNPSGSSSQLWYFGYKSYDNTFRIRWPTYFATSMNLGPGSYTTINGISAPFRSYDTDNGANRPSYTTPGPKSRFSGEVTCILYTPAGQAVAWFKTRAEARTQGRLP